MSDVKNNTEVLIVGAGPSGLMMACQLAMHQIPFRIIDKKESATHCSGALVIQARTLEILDQMDVTGKAINEGIQVSQIRIIFNGRKPLLVKIKDIGGDLSKFPSLLLLEQSTTEKILIDYISKYGYEVERKIELMDFGQDAVGVTSLVKHSDGTDEVIKSQYLVAADGGQSAIRKQLNIPFLGKTHELSLFVTDCQSDINLAPDEICFSFSKMATSGFFPLKNGRWRIDGALSAKSGENNLLSFSDVEKDFALRNLMNIRLYSPEWFSVFHSHQRYASTFQQKRCFLVGDAAHVYSPVGAQGMNTGMQDAYNLAWKIAFVSKGKAKASLLNTYTEERQPISKRLVNATDRVFKLVTSENFNSKTIRLYLAPIVIKLVVLLGGKRKFIHQFLFKHIGQLGIHYRKSYDQKLFSNGKFNRKAPRPGDRLPYILYRLGNMEVTIQEIIEGSNFHLLAFVSGNRSEEVNELVGEFSDSLVVHIINYMPETMHLFKKLGITRDGFYLIRPDMHIAYRSNGFELEHFKHSFHNLLAR